jgi:hypothetical protein
VPSAARVAPSRAGNVGVVPGAVGDVVGNRAVPRPSTCGRVGTRLRIGTFTWALLPLLAACGGDASVSQGTSVAIDVASTAPVVPPPTNDLAVPPTTVVSTTSVSTTVLSTTTTAPAPPPTPPPTTAASQYGLYTVQPDLSVSPTPTEQHQVLWDLFRRVLGDAATAQYIESFEVYNDPNRNIDATLSDGQTPGKQRVSVNARYADDLTALTRTFIHEYGHIITLAPDQMTSGGGSCAGTSLDEGCLARDSYLNGFLDRFWWVYGQEVFDALASPAAMDAFYAAHQTDFVTRYAATDPLEDIAEVWAEFVIRDAVTGSTIADKKILYLYGFPELVALRDEIRARVADMLGI